MAGRGKLNAVPKAAVADLGGGGDVKGRARSQRNAKKARRNKLLWAEAMELAKTYDIAVTKGNSIVDVLQTLLDRLMDKWRFVCLKVDRLDESEWLVSRIDDNGNVLLEPNIWIQWEAALRAELMDLSLRMGHLGVDERRVLVQEAQVQLLGRAVLAAAQSIGLAAPVVKQLGAALRNEIKRAEEGVDSDTGLPNYPGHASVRGGKGGKRASDKHPVINGTSRPA